MSGLCSGMTTPDTFQQQLQDRYIIPFNKLLTKLRACSPVAPNIREKVRLCARLREYYKGLEQYRAQLVQPDHTDVINIINPVLNGMKAALEKFEAWVKQESQVTTEFESELSTGSFSSGENGRPSASSPVLPSRQSICDEQPVDNIVMSE
eukprot:720298_1